MKKTKSNTDFCMKQVLRMDGTINFFPSGNEGAVKEFANALREAAPSLQTAEAIIDRVLHTCPDRPPTAHLFAIAREMEAAAARLPAPCANCADLNGYVLVERVIRSGMFAGERRSGVDPCSCPLGRALASKAAELKSANPPARELRKLKAPFFVEQRYPGDWE